MGLVVGWVRNGRTGGRKVGLRGRKICCLGRRRKVLLGRIVFLGRNFRKVFLWKRNVGIGARKVGIVVDLAFVGGVGVVVVQVRNRGTGGRKNTLRRRWKGGIGRERKGFLGRRNKAPLVIGWRERKSSCKAGKNEGRDDFQLHIVFFFVVILITGIV